MPKQFDPLSCIPSAETVRRKLSEAERLASRLRILLNTAEALEQSNASAETDSAQTREASK